VRVCRVSKFAVYTEVIVINCYSSINGFSICNDNRSYRSEGVELGAYSLHPVKYIICIEIYIAVNITPSKLVYTHLNI
jgi:hypothetical protein